MLSPYGYMEAESSSFVFDVADFMRRRPVP